MTNKMKTIISLLLLYNLCGCMSKEPDKPNLEGQSLPSFSIMQVDSSIYSITNSNNRPAVLFYFGPRCPYSKAQIEEITKNNDALREIQFYVFTSYPYNEMETFYKKYELYKYPNIITGIDYTNFFPKHFDANWVPYLIIYGKDKIYKESYIGKVESKKILEAAYQ